MRNLLLRKLYRRRQYVMALCVLVWVAAFAATHIPGGKLPPLHVGDKILHATGYFTLSCAFILALMAYRIGTTHRVVLVIGIMTIYAAMDEITQQLVNRNAALDDWIADIVGVVAAVITVEILLWALGHRRFRRGDAGVHRAG